MKSYMDNSNQLTTVDGSHHQVSESPPQPHLPPGFRFHPTDEELVVQYLKRKVQSIPLPVSIIADVDLYKFDPWELPAKAVFGEQEWYFFSPRDRKYPNGARPNRAAISGYWKATGTDKPVLSSGNNMKVGVKKALVFYGGKPPRGIKTNWIMHEYRLVDNNKPINKPPGYDHSNTTTNKASLRLDDWVLCRIYKKNNSNRPMDHHEREDSMEDMLMMGPMSMSMSIPSSINNIGHHQHPLSKTAGSLNYSTFLNNHVDHHGTIFDGMMGATHGMDPTSSSNSIPLKRPLPGLFWPVNSGTGDGDGDGDGDDAGVGAISSPSKRVSLLQISSDDDNNNNNNNTEKNGVRCDYQGNTSMSSLLNQLPSPTTPGTMLDGMFRQSYSLSGLNWYS